MNVTFCTIVFNGDYVLKQMLESIYPFAHKIIIVDGVVEYWNERGFTGSTDNTVRIVEKFPDPQNKIILHKGVVAKEKTELCRVFMKDVPDDTDYLWCPDSDELFMQESIKKVFNVLETVKPKSMGFQSNTFFGGFEYILGGFEQEHNFKRVLKYRPGCTYVDHRPPTLSCETDLHFSTLPHINGKYMSEQHGVEMYHYSYVWPKQVKDKIDYYKKAVSKDNCIDNYFENIWLKWVRGNDLERDSIEAAYNGVHEFKPAYRGECRTKLFTQPHPLVIRNSIKQLKQRFDEELEQC